ncbi:hypothetical protein HYX08_03955 [Candidatus Woesearchaeota archaeon]|nr:hypothetical protein [Candidatus Woesearchaeota archaeon]
MNRKGQGSGVPFWVILLILAILAFLISIFFGGYIKQLLGIGTSYGSIDFDKDKTPEPGKTKNLIINAGRLITLPSFIIFNLK